MKRDVEELGRPCLFLLLWQVRHTEVMRMPDDMQGVRPVDSTPRMGEPFTWGSDRQEYVAFKGNINRI